MKRLIPLGLLLLGAAFSLSRLKKLAAVVPGITGAAGLPGLDPAALTAALVEAKKDQGRRMEAAGSLDSLGPEIDAQSAAAPAAASMPAAPAVDLSEPPSPPPPPTGKGKGYLADSATGRRYEAKSSRGGYAEVRKPVVRKPALAGLRPLPLGLPSASVPVSPSDAPPSLNRVYGMALGAIAFFIISVVVARRRFLS